MSVPLLLFRKPQKKTQSGVDTSSLLNGLTHYWKMDETTGNRLDSVGAFHMVPYNTAGYEAGLIGNASTLGGSPNALRNVSAILSVPATGATVWGWIKLGSTGAMAIINSNVSTLYWGLVHQTTDTWRFFVIDTVSGSSAASDTVSDVLGAWYFVCGRYNSTTKKAELRVNNRAWTLGSALSNEPAPTTGDLWMNRYGASYGTCSLDEIGFAERYFSNADVDLLYNGGAGRSYPF